MFLSVHKLCLCDKVASVGVFRTNLYQNGSMEHAVGTLTSCDHDGA
jgi:hypothetical protein